MVKECKCGQAIYCLNEESEIECNNCGSITYPDGRVINIGITRYKFKDINYNYVHVFNEKEELEDFVKYVKSNPNDYESCEILTPEGLVTLI